MCFKNVDVRAAHISITITINESSTEVEKCLLDNLQIELPCILLFTCI